MVEKIYVAVVGAGYWGKKLIREYYRLSKENPMIELKVIVDVSEERLNEISSDLKISNVILTKDIDEVANNDDIHAVHIATPNNTHFKLASLMLTNHKNVLLEKPLALNSRDAFKLARMSEELNKVLMVGHLFRFNNAIKKIKRVINYNKEKILYIDLTWTTWMTPPKDRDIIFDLAPHPVDILNYITDEWPFRTYTVAKSYVRKKEGLEEFAYSILDLPNDIEASIKLSWIEKGPKLRLIKIITDKNAYVIDALEQKILKYFNSDKVGSIPVKPSNTIREMIEHFINRIMHGGASKNSALIGALTVTVLEAMHRSALLKKPINILINPY